MEKLEFKFNGNITFDDDNMIVSYNVMDGDNVVSSFKNTIDCDIEALVQEESEPEKGFFKKFKGSKPDEATFSSGIWTILLKDVLKTIGGILIAQIKKKVEKKIKKKFHVNDDKEVKIPAGAFYSKEETITTEYKDN